MPNPGFQSGAQQAGSGLSSLITAPLVGLSLALWQDSLLWSAEPHLVPVPDLKSSSKNQPSQFPDGYVSASHQTVRHWMERQHRQARLRLGSVNFPTLAGETLTAPNSRDIPRTQHWSLPRPGWDGALEVRPQSSLASSERARLSGRGGHTG